MNQRTHTQQAVTAGGGGEEESLAKVGLPNRLTPFFEVAENPLR